jgi:hypothetical protein
MKVFVARSISYILNPLNVLIFAPFLLIYRSTYDVVVALHWTVYTVVFLMLLALFVVLGVKNRVFTDLDISKREQRPLMFLVSLLFGTVYLITLFILHGPFILFILTVSVLLGLCFVSIINQWVKASMHVAAISALVLPVAISFGKYYLLLLLLIPLVIWARLTTKRHTVPEVIAGGFIGSILSLSIYIAVKFFLRG